MATQKTVLVTFEPSTGALSIDPQSPLTLENPDDWVVWTLSPTSEPLPANTQILLHFEDRLGPFQAVRIVTPETLIAKGNTGTRGNYFYSLALVTSLSQLAPPPVLQPFGPFTIDNQCSQENTSPRATVTYIPAKGNEPARLDVRPTQLLLHEGDIALWHVENVPADHHLAFQLDSDHFSSVFLGHTAEESTRRFGGALFLDPTPETVQYRIVVWSAAGGTPTIKDPTIDGLGRPPGT